MRNKNLAIGCYSLVLETYTFGHAHCGGRALVMAHLPTREEWVEMLGKARANTAEAVGKAKQAGNLALLLQYQVQLAGWDRLIDRIRDTNPFV